MDNLIAISSWSAGKDSCLACYKAIKNGYCVKYLLNFISKEFKRCCFHGIEADLIKLQAELIGIPLAQKEVTQDMQAYENEFKEAVRAIKDAEDVDSMVFGDIYLDEHKDWVDRVCKDLDIIAVEPLWKNSASSILEEFIGLGFKAIVVSCQADKFGKDFVGREVDKNLLAELRSKNICPCGENGEFHTLVVDGPMFKKKIQILESKPILKESFWKYWFLDIKKYTIATVVCIAMVANLAIAKEETTEKFNLGKIIVTPSKLQQAYGDSTANISIIEEKDIKASGAKEINQILDTQPSVEIFQYGSAGSTKTIHTRGASDSQVITLIDGRPTNTPRDGVTDFNKIPLNNIERIEVLRGPASSIYGANAIGGVINIITKSGKKDGKDEISMKYGSEDTKTVDLLTQGKEGRFDYLFFGGWTRSSGFRENSDYRRRNINSTFGFDVSEKNRVKFATGYSLSKLGTPGQITNEDLDDRQNTKSNYFDLTWDASLWQDSKILFKAYQIMDRLEFLESTSPYDISAHTTKVYGTNLQVSQEWFDMLTATFGVDGQENRINSSSSQKHTYNFKAAYLETEAKPFKGVNIKGGARIDDYSNFGNRASPSASFSWWMFDSLKFHGLWGKSFRAPTFNDLYWPKEDYGVWGGVEGNPHLKPEIAKSYEAGVTTYLFNAFETDVTYFNNKFKDLIAWQADENFWYRPSNVNNALIEGIEVNTNFQPFRKVKANANYTYMQAKDESTHKWLTYRPQNIYKGSIDYGVTDKLNLYFTCKYVTKRYHNDTNTVFLKDYFAADGNIAYKLNDYVQLSLAVNNIFDRDYQEVYNYPMQGTSVLAEISMSY